jgi:hypothetical protein
MTPVAGFHEEWFSEFSQHVLADLVRGVVDVPGLIVEIGSWEGRSTVAMANAAFPRMVHAVDTWQGSPFEISAGLAQRRDVFAQWSTNIEMLTRSNVVAHRMGWREFVPTVTEPLALCFIDAEHSYLEVRDNLLAVIPLMSPGGIICGDDVHHPPVRQALTEVLGEWLQEASLFIWQVPT